MFMPIRTQGMRTIRRVLSPGFSNVFVKSLFGFTLLSSVPFSVTADDENEVYELAFFEKFRPQNALDIVNQVPGFTFDKGDDVRGFANAAGNVLINGARPSSKTGGIEDALKRIPAGQVVRVEIIRGTAGAGETAGQAVVLNVIRVTKEQSGTWTVALGYPQKGRLSPEFEGVLSKKMGEWDTAFKLNGFYEHFPRKAVITHQDANGSVTSTQNEDRPAALTDLFLSADFGRKFGEKSLQLTTRWGWSRYHSFTDRDRFLPNSNERSEIFASDRNSRYFLGEIGADWTQPVWGDYKWRLIGLASGQHWWVIAPSRITELASNSVTGSDFDFERNKFEGILRTVFSKSSGKLKPEFGGEFAYNMADYDISLTRFDNGTVTPVELSAANVLVQELRGEAFANVIWQLNSKLSFESGLAFEVSRIMVSGDAENAQTLSYLKPKAAVVYRFSDKLQTRFSYTRSIGQLDFEAFAASADFERDRTFGGNPELRPHRSSRISNTLTWTFMDGGALNAEFYYEWLAGVQEQILLPSGASGTGDAGNATIKGLDITATLPIPQLLRGAQLEMAAKALWSELDDEIIGRQRRLTGEDQPEIEFKFRHDVPDYPVSWGAGVELNTDSVSYFVSDVSAFKEKGRWNAFVETSAVKGLRIRLDYKRQDSYLERTLFSPTRGGAHLSSELHDREATSTIKLTISGQF